MQLDGYALLTINDYDGNHDHYVDPSLLANATDDDLCYLCTSRLSDGHVVRTTCGCGRIIHTSCLHRLLKYGLKCSVKGEQRPPMIRICGMCRRPLLGVYEYQHKITTVAYRKFFLKSPIDCKKDLSELSPIMFSMKQIIKYVRLFWRSTVERNAVVSELMASLGHCYSTMHKFSPEIKISKECKKMAFVACYFSLRLHNNSNNMGTHNVAFVCDVIVQHQRDSHLQFGRYHLPTVFNYLFMLINTTAGATSMQNEDLEDVVFVDVGSVHASAQTYILNILKSLVDVDPEALRWFRHKLFFFLLHGAKWGERMDKDDVSMNDDEMGEVKEEEWEGGIEDYHTICPTRRMFEYILEHLDETFAGEIKEKIELLKKLKTVSQTDRNWCDPFPERMQLVEHKLSLLALPG
jgi:hypothetical protein